MANNAKGYLNAGLGDLVNLILAIIPFTSWILGGITRILRGHIIAGIFHLLTPMGFVFWIVDIYHVATVKDLKLWA